MDRAMICCILDAINKSRKRYNFTNFYFTDAQAEQIRSIFGLETSPLFWQINSDQTPIIYSGASVIALSDTEKTLYITTDPCSCCGGNLGREKDNIRTIFKNVFSSILFIPIKHCC